MPIELTEPFAVGSLDEEDYTHAKIVSFQVSTQDKLMRLTVRLGTYVGGVFKAGMVVKQKTIQQIEITGDDYDLLVGKLTSAQGAKIYDELAREMMIYLINKGHYSGSVV